MKQMSCVSKTLAPYCQEKSRGEVKIESEKERQILCMCNFVCVCVCVWVCVCMRARVNGVIRQQLLGFNLLSHLWIFLPSLASLSLSLPPPPLTIPPPWDLLPYSMCICGSCSVSSPLLLSLSLSSNRIILSISLCLPRTHPLLRFIENTPTLFPVLATISRLPTLCRW